MPTDTMQLFPRADLPKFRVLENPPSVPKSSILIDQDVAYFRDPKASEPTKVRLYPRFHVPMTLTPALTDRQFSAHHRDRRVPSDRPPHRRVGPQARDHRGRRVLWHAQRVPQEAHRQHHRCIPQREAAYREVTDESIVLPSSVLYM